MNHDFFHVQLKQFVELWSTYENMTLTFNLEIQYGSRGCRGKCSC